jgi:hypothetical protein
MGTSSSSYDLGIEKVRKLKFKKQIFFFCNQLRLKLKKLDQLKVYINFIHWRKNVFVFLTLATKRVNIRVKELSKRVKDKRVELDFQLNELNENIRIRFFPRRVKCRTFLTRRIRSTPTFSFARPTIKQVSRTNKSETVTWYHLCSIELNINWLYGLCFFGQISLFQSIKKISFLKNLLKDRLPPSLAGCQKFIHQECIITLNSIQSNWKLILPQDKSHK